MAGTSALSGIRPLTVAARTLLFRSVSQPANYYPLQPNKKRARDFSPSPLFVNDSRSQRPPHGALEYELQTKLNNARFVLLVRDDSERC